MAAKGLHLGYSSLLLVLLIFTGVTGNTFKSITTCSCVGQNVLFNCTTNGDGFTVWSGTAFTCTAREITLTHNDRFTQSVGSCTDEIIAQGVVINGSAHTSQLNVTLSAGLVGRTIECTLDSTDLNDVVHIGNYTLFDQSSLGPFPAPSKITLNENVGPNLISFTWNKVEGHDGCSSLRYVVNSTNCGTCSPNMTVSNVATCTDFRSILLGSNNTCRFTVQSVICDDIAGNVSSKVIILKVPDPPIVQVLPVYRSGTPTSPPSLIELVTSFGTVDSFIISNNPVVNGSARSYTITYSDSATGETCYSATVLDSSCFNGSCNHTFEESKSECPSLANISIAVFATNVLGNGSSSATIERSGLNRYVNVAFSPMTRKIQCTFLSQRTTDGSKECNATVTYGDDCDQPVGVYPSGISSNTSVTTSQIELIDGIFEYCLTVTARNGNVTVMVRGNNIVNIADPNNNVALAAIVTVLLVFGAIVTLTITALAVVYIYKYRSKSNRLSDHEDIHWIKFSINERSSLTLSDALEIFKRNDVKVLEVNTNLLQSDDEANSNTDHTVYFVLCTCTEEDRHQLLSLNLNNLEKVKGFNPAGPGPLSLILKFTLPKETPEKIVGAINLIEGIGNSRIRCINTQHKRGKFFVKVRCSNTTKTKLLESLVDELDSDGDSIQFGPIRTRRAITCLVREEATGIKSVLEAFATCQLNITEVNPKYVPGFDLDAPRNPVDGTNYVECCCSQENLRTLLEVLKEPKYGILTSSHLSSYDDDLKELQDRSCYKHHHVVKFSLMNCEGALSYAMSAFADSGVRVIGLNTIKCPPEELNIRILYRRSRLRFAYTESEKLDELKTKLNATGTAIVTPSSEDTNELIHVLIKEDEIPVDGRTLPLTIQDVFHKLQIHLPSNDLDCPESNYSVVVIYQRMGILYKSTDEQKENLEKQLMNTGFVINIGSQNVPVKRNIMTEQTTMV